jgi:hypothetical protein
VLLTRSRLCPGPKPGSSLHLHVLSLPPAFVLSQDQTLRKRAACPVRRDRGPEAVAGRVRPAGTSLIKSLSSSRRGPPDESGFPADEVCVCQVVPPKRAEARCGGQTWALVELESSTCTRC